MKKVKTNKKTKPTTKKATSAPVKSVANKKVEQKQVAPIKSVDDKKVEQKQVASTTKAVAVTAKSAKKPLIIALSASAAVAAGLGVGCFFIGKNAGGGGSGTSGYTVVLSAGKNAYFANEGQYTLVLEGVEEGTKLQDIAGYMLPTEAGNMDFADWIIDDSTVTFKENDLITSNLNLTATYTENITSLRANALKDIRDCYSFISSSFSKRDPIHTYLDSLYDKITKDKDSPLLKTEDKGLLTSFRDFSIKSFIALATSESDKYAEYTNLIIEAIDGIAEQESVAKAAARAAISSAYVTAVTNPDAAGVISNINKMKEQLINELGKDEDVKRAKVIEIIAEGAMNASIYVIDSKQKDLLDSIDIYASEFVKLSNQEEHKEKTSFIEDLSKLTNSLYNALTKVADDSDYGAIQQLHKAAQEIYLNSEGTVIDKEVYDLYASGLESVASKSNEIKAENLANDILATIGQYHNLAQDPAYANEISFLQNICKQRIKAVSKLSDTDKNLDSLIQNLLSNWRDNNLDENIKNFINLVMETAADMQPKASQELGAGYGTLNNNAMLCFNSGLLPVLKVSTSDSTRLTRIKIVNELNEGLIKSSKYSNVDMHAQGALIPKYNELFDALSTLEAAKFSGVAIRIEAESIIYSSAALSLSKFGFDYSKYKAVTMIPNILQPISTELGQLYDSTGWEYDVVSESVLFYANELKNNLWNALTDFAPYFETGSPQEFIQKITGSVTSLPGKAVGIDHQHWMNLVKTSSLSFSQTNFYSVYVDGKYSEAGSMERLKYFLDKCFVSMIGTSDYLNSPYFNDILDVWKNDFFDNITYTTSVTEMGQIFEAAKAKADEIATKKANISIY